MGNTFTIGKKFIHPVAESYFLKVAAAGGNVVDKDIVNTFVWELSRVIDPNLWVCWPLRSSQSMGTGTVAPSLGLLGDYPGTLVNGPTWSTDGLVQNATNQRIATNFDISINGSFFGVVNRTSGSIYQYFGQRTNMSTNNPITISLHDATSQMRFAYYDPTGRVVAGPSGTTPGIFQSHSCVWTPSAVSLVLNNNILVQNSAIPSGPMIAGDQQNDIMLGNSFGGITDSRGICPIYLFFSNMLTLQQCLTVYTLYKNTLGKGLGLP